MERNTHYSREYMHEKEISDAVLDNYKDHNPTLSEVDFASAGLKSEDYIDLYSPDEYQNQFVSVHKKGMTAILSHHFYNLIDARNAEIQQREATKITLESLSHQKLINWVLICATILAAVMPFVVAYVFPSKTIVNYPERGVRQDIRIDSVWLHQQVDDLIQKAISNQIRVEPTKSGH
jgi:type IV secretory pathway component VirB8